MVPLSTPTSNECQIYGSSSMTCMTSYIVVILIVFVMTIWVQHYSQTNVIRTRSKPKVDSPSLRNHDSGYAYYCLQNFCPFMPFESPAFGLTCWDGTVVRWTKKLNHIMDIYTIIYYILLYKSFDSLYIIHCI